MTDKTLKENIQTVLELGSKRTQGDWEMYLWSDVEGHTADDGGYVATNRKNDDYDEIISGNNENCLHEDNAAFIASAPLMIDIIRQQQELLDSDSGMETDLHELIRVCMTRDTDVLRDFIKLNYPTEYEDYDR